MGWLLLSNLIILCHGLFILFVVFGGLLVVRFPRLIWLHLPAVCWGILVEVMGWVCPLTIWENHFRRLAGREIYEGDFIGEYLLPLIYPEELTRNLQITLGLLVLLINLLTYLWIGYRRRKLRQEQHIVK
ncbi:MAG: DUF2784 domain-containing protein [Gammaproteobacteria bacterium]|nr:DUF2784 domain-containing protein [Gammaproteobacteria bacterium]MDH5650822.1 DUF2784 domain-containing protein [Gammaproteobacteria bacterium]